MATKAPTSKTYIVTPYDGTDPFEVVADRYEFPESTGRHMFYEGDELVANLLNVQVRRK